MYKKLLFVLGLAITLNAGVWTSVSGFSKKEIDPDVTYTLDTIGQDPRVYEFTPKANKNYACVIIYTEGASAPVMQCFPKETKK